MFSTLATQFNAGGPFMWVLLVVLAAAAAVILERMVYYFIYCRWNGRRIAGTIAQAIAGGRADEARAAVCRGTTPLVQMLRAAVEEYQRNRDNQRVQRAIEQAAIREVPRLSKRLNYLSLIANIATLLGLLGTIAGLQVSFGSLGSVDASQKAAMLADGIAQAMNTTAFGLIVAVPCMIAYTLLNNKQQALVRDMDDAVVTVLNTMYGREER